MNNITLSLLGGALVTGSAFAGEVVAPVYVAAPSYEADVTVGVHSDYIFRGARLGSDLVDGSVNVSKSAWGLDFTAGAWYGSFEEENSRFNTNEDELDLTVGVSKDFGFARFNTGYIYYNTSTLLSNNDASEIYVGFSKDLCYGLSTSLTYFIDTSGDLGGDDEYENNGYTELSFAKSDLFLEGLTLSNDLGYLVELGQLNHNTTTLGYDYALSENATVTPYLAYTFELDGLDEIQGEQQNRFHGGVALTVSF